MRHTITSNKAASSTACMRSVSNTATATCNNYSTSEP
jgi:hypothetical protein